MICHPERRLPWRPELQDLRLLFVALRIRHPIQVNFYALILFTRE